MARLRMADRTLQPLDSRADQGCRDACAVVIERSCLVWEEGVTSLVLVEKEKTVRFNFVRNFDAEAAGAVLEMEQDWRGVGQIKQQAA